MALQFPSASVGERYSIVGSATYEWNGLYWDIIQPDQISTISASLSQTASFALTASYINVQALTGSIENAQTASLAITASYSHTASLAHTASYAYNFVVGNNLTVRGILSASFLYADSSSVVFTSGSNVIGNSTANTQAFTGSVGVTGSLVLDNATRAVLPNLTGSLFGTASWSVNSISSSISVTSSYALTASFFSGSIPSSSYAVTASNSLTASTILQTATASLSLTSSYMLGATGSVGNLTVTSILVADYLLTEDYADDAAAAAGGVPLYGIYRSGNMVVVRIV